MKKNQRHRRLLLLILIPPILAICLCLAFSAPPIFKFLNSAAFPDYLWAQSITRTLRSKGYSVDGTANISRSKSPPITLVGVGINSLEMDKQIEPYKLVKDVHSIVINSFTETSPKPQPVDIIFVSVDGGFDNSYAVEISFEDAQKFQAGEISEQEYFERWTVHSNTIKITPP